MIKKNKKKPFWPGQEVAITQGDDDGAFYKYNVVD